MIIAREYEFMCTSSFIITAQLLYVGIHIKGEYLFIWLFALFFVSRRRQVCWHGDWFMPALVGVSKNIFLNQEVCL